MDATAFYRQFLHIDQPHAHQHALFDLLSTGPSPATPSQRQLSLEMYEEPPLSISDKIPCTHQSGLVYPLPPPSTLKGLLANALQRWEDIGSREALAEVEREVRCTAAFPLSPIMMKEHIVSSVNKLEAMADRKATDAISRQFAFTHRLGVAVHTQCWRPQALHPYLFPLTRRGDMLLPAAISGQLAQLAEIAEGPTFGSVIIPPRTPQAQPRPRRRRKS
jgi:CRISPR-associated protein (Cas_Cas5)